MANMVGAAGTAVMAVVAHCPSVGGMLAAMLSRASTFLRYAASSHVAKDLVVPKNIRLLHLPPYAPELNPQDHVWDGRFIVNAH